MKLYFTQNDLIRVLVELVFKLLYSQLRKFGNTNIKSWEILK